MRKLLVLIIALTPLLSAHAADLYDGIITYEGAYMDNHLEIKDETPGFDDNINYTPDKKNIIYVAGSNGFGNLMIYNISSDQQFILNLTDSNSDDRYVELLYSNDKDYFGYRIEIGSKPLNEFCFFNLASAYEDINEYLKDPVLEPISGIQFKYPFVRSKPICLSKVLSEHTEFKNKDVQVLSWNSKAIKFATQDNFKTSNWAFDLQTNELLNLGVASPFSDLSANDPDFETVLQAKAEGWLTGYPDGTVGLDKPINRAEFVKIMIQAFDNTDDYQRAPSLLTPIFEVTPPAEVQMICPDAPVGVWYSPSFYAAKQIGVIQGYPDENKPKDQWLCKPGDEINKVEALKVVLSLLELQDREALTQYSDTLNDMWYSPFTAYAKAYELIRTSNNKLNPSASLTRREMIYLAIRIKDLEKEWEVGG